MRRNIENAAWAAAIIVAWVLTGWAFITIIKEYSK